MRAVSRWAVVMIAAAMLAPPSAGARDQAPLLVRVVSMSGTAAAGEGSWQDVARCGGLVSIAGREPGFSPVNRTCNEYGVRSTYGTQMVIGIGQGYTNGTITAKVTGLTFGGSWTVSCQIIVFLPELDVAIGSCSEDRGSLGYETVRLEGSSTGTGLWEVAYQQWVN